MQQRSRRKTSGQSLLEFALMAPLFFLLLFGAIDLGRAVYIYNAVSDAAREGARAAVPAQDPLPDNNALVSAVQSKLGGGISITVDPCVNLPTPCAAMQNPPTEPNTGVVWFTNPRPAGRTPVSVEIVYYFAPFVPLVREAAGNRIQLRARTTMVTEY
jgi:Flp pilus assembly protein TadG